MIENLIGSGDRPFRVWTLEQRHRHMSRDTGRLQHAEIPAGAPVLDHQARQFVHPPASGQLPARLPRLADFEPRLANAEHIANVHRSFIQTGNGQILAEGAVRHIHLQLVPPFVVMIGTVGQHCLVDAAVIFKVGLTVTFQICVPTNTGPSTGVLKKPVVHPLS